MENLRSKIQKYDPSKIEEYCIQHWNEYKIVNTKEDFIAVMISLNIFGESLEGLYEGYSFGGFVLAESMEDVINAILEYTCIYDNFDKYMEVVKENYEYDNEGETFEEYFDFFEINGDCDVVEYQGKIYKRIYC